MQKSLKASRIKIKGMLTKFVKTRFVRLGSWVLKLKFFYKEQLGATRFVRLGSWVLKLEFFYKEQLGATRFVGFEIFFIRKNGGD